MDIRAVLLAPEEGDPHGLLREGPCGARPPAAWQDPRNTHGHHHEWHPGAEHSVPGDRRALVLAWDGEVVAEGVLRLRLAWPWTSMRWWQAAIEEALSGEAVSEHDWPGTIILLDADGREVTDG